MIESLRIGCRIYRVDWPSDCKLEDDDSWAEHDVRRGCLRVATFQRPPDAIAEKLIHEILHAILDDTGQDWGAKMEERIVSALSPRLAAFMRDNVESCVEILNMLSK